jgi:hypothetical protein
MVRTRHGRRRERVFSEAARLEDGLWKGEVFGQDGRPALSFRVAWNALVGTEGSSRAEACLTRNCAV